MELTTDGLQAVATIAAALADFAAVAIWCSPALRCRAVADTLATLHVLTPRIDARLQELDFGDWERRAWNGIPRTALDQWAASPLGFAPPGGETGAALLARVTAVHTDLLARTGPVIIVSHGGPLKLLAALLRGAPVDLLAPAPALGSITIITP